MSRNLIDSTRERPALTFLQFADDPPIAFGCYLVAQALGELTMAIIPSVTCCQGIIAIRINGSYLGSG